MHRGDYLKGNLNETQVRVMYIDPLFELLGWDVHNKNGYAEAYKDVVHEESLKIGASSKAPDYCFRIGGNRKFFLEAKRPSVFIKEAVSASYQLRRYGWSAKLPLSILTDFEEFAVYDCRLKPKATDKVSKGRIAYFTYKEYLEQWDQISSIYSREAVLKGSFDRFVETTKTKKGTAEVDSAFLQEIDSWREQLARNLALRNPGLSQRELNFSVQRIIDRIIFLRMCEDRGIEFYGRLWQLLNGTQVYPRLYQLFKEADTRYNSGLFHFSKEKGRATPPDDLTPDLKVDDKILKEIFKNLYYPDSPYEFSVLPAEILGQVYEQFLGKVIRVTKKGQAKVEEKPEVKKAGGVYYTPAYIVDYIVARTVGKLLEGKKPGRGVDGIKVLDPACGSGSFLIGAYQYLIDWYRDYYEKEGNKKQKQLIFQAQGGEWRLTTAEKKRILLTHIYGVDIDPQAVEVTKLSLLLKVLEGESDETLKKQMQLFKERALPDLGENIKCGNSLIGSDFYQGQQMGFLDEEEQYRINCFDWNQEFAEIMRTGGFSSVIGNPPYVRQEGLAEFKDYFQKHFKVYHGMADLYSYFMERGVGLLREGGMFSYIVANKWMRANYGAPLRRWMGNHGLKEIVDFGDLPVFHKATTYPCIVVMEKRERKGMFQAANIQNLQFQSLLQEVEAVRFNMDSSELDPSGWTLQDMNKRELLEKIKSKGIPLGDYVDNKIFYGIKTGLNEAFVIDSETRKNLINEFPDTETLIKPFLRGKDIKRYKTPQPERYLILIERGWTDKNRGKQNPWNWFRKNFPPVASHLEKYKVKAQKRCDQGDYWWELRACDYYKEFEKHKIIFPAIVKRPCFVIEKNSMLSNDKTSIISSEDHLLLGLLNSRTVQHFMSLTSSTKQGGFFEYKPMYVQKIPIPNSKNNSDKSIEDKIRVQIEKLLNLNGKLDITRSPDEKTFLQKQINATDREIDNLVYQLYDLTPEEISIIEESIK